VDAGQAGVTTFVNVVGNQPHQPLGYDQYALLYRKAKVLRSSAKFTVTFATRDGYAQSLLPAGEYDQKGVDVVDTYNGGGDLPARQYPVATSAALTQKFPPGLYVGLIRVNSLNPIILPQTYTEYLERFKAPLKFVPYLRDKAAFKTVTLIGLYQAPSAGYLRSLITYNDVSDTATNSRGDRMVDMLTTHCGDHPYEIGGVTFNPREGFVAKPPVAKYHWKLIVYYPDSANTWRLPGAGDTFVDAVSMRATVNIRYRVRFSSLRMLRRSWLTSTPGVNEQHLGGGVPLAGGGSAVVTSSSGINPVSGPAQADKFNEAPIQESPVSDDDV
jgi:hypothetical protein